MNWMGGPLRQSKKSSAGITEKQKAYFATTRARLQSSRQDLTLTRPPHIERRRISSSERKPKVSPIPQQRTNNASYDYPGGPRVHQRIPRSHHEHEQASDSRRQHRPEEPAANDNLESKRLEILQRDTLLMPAPPRLPKRPELDFRTTIKTDNFGRRRKRSASESIVPVAKRVQRHIPTRLAQMSLEKLRHEGQQRYRSSKADEEEISISMGSHIHGSQHTYLTHQALHEHQRSSSQRQSPFSRTGSIGERRGLFVDQVQDADHDTRMMDHYFSSSPYSPSPGNLRRHPHHPLYLSQTSPSLATHAVHKKDMKRLRRETREDPSTIKRKDTLGTIPHKSYDDMRDPYSRTALGKNKGEEYSQLRMEFRSTPPTALDYHSPAPILEDMDDPEVDPDYSILAEATEQQDFEPASSEEIEWKYIVGVQNQPRESFDSPLNVKAMRGASKRGLTDCTSLSYSDTQSAPSLPPLPRPFLADTHPSVPIDKHMTHIVPVGKLETKSRGHEKQGVVKEAAEGPELHTPRHEDENLSWFRFVFGPVGEKPDQIIGNKPDRPVDLEDLQEDGSLGFPEPELAEFPIEYSPDLLLHRGDTFSRDSTVGGDGVETSLMVELSEQSTKCPTFKRPPRFKSGDSLNSQDRRSTESTGVSSSSPHPNSSSPTHQIRTREGSTGRWSSMAVNESIDENVVG
ncbi:hypothetical protein MMC25_000351 [Agyrium rufum]|nr:hypothetical protein [Agyrium rufum]